MSKIEIKEIRSVKKLKWLEMKNASVVYPNGLEEDYEFVERTTTKNGLDGVDIIAIVENDVVEGGEDELLLVKQFRIPTKHFVIEFPAGLMEDGETAAQAALRELAEETGHVGGVVCHVSPGQPLPLECSISNANSMVVYVKMKKSLNTKPLQHLDATEDISFFSVPLKGLLPYLQAQSMEGVLVDAKLYTFALGLQFDSIKK